VSTTRQTGWTSWTRFAAVFLIVSGIFSVVEGIVGLISPDAYFVVAHGRLFLFDISGWGWWTLILGILLIIIGVFLYIGTLWARAAAVIIAALSAIVQLLLIPAQPWWSMVVIAVDLLIIFAIAAHGRDQRSDS
jgi:hypothetical protein